MAITVTKVTSWLARDAAMLRCGYVDIDLGVYATDGVAVDADDIAKGLTIYELTEVNGGGVGVKLVYDTVNEKIVAFDYATDGSMTEIADSTDLAGTDYRFYYAGV